MNGALSGSTSGLQFGGAQTQLFSFRPSDAEKQSKGLYLQYLLLSISPPKVITDRSTT